MENYLMRLKYKRGELGRSSLPIRGGRDKRERGTSPFPVRGRKESEKLFTHKGRN